MKYKITYKAQDEKLKTLIIRKWRLAYSTRDNSIPDIAERNVLIDAKNKREVDGVKLNAFEAQLAPASLFIVFGKKALDKIPQEIKDMAPKFPQEFILTDVYYVVKDKKLFINFFSDITLKENRV